MNRQMKKILPDEAYKLYPGAVVALTGEDRDIIHAHAATIEELKPLVEGLGPEEYVIVPVPKGPPRAS